MLSGIGCENPPTTGLTVVPSVAVPPKLRDANVKDGPASVRMMGEVPPRGEQLWPTFMPLVQAVPVPGPNDVSVMVRPGSSGNVTGASIGDTPPTGGPVGVMGRPPLMLTGSPGVSA